LEQKSTAQNQDFIFLPALPERRAGSLLGILELEKYSSSSTKNAGLPVLWGGENIKITKIDGQNRGSKRTPNNEGQNRNVGAEQGKWAAPGVPLPWLAGH
jgi:hypothetical protein